MRMRVLAGILATLTVMAVLVASTSAQNTNPRFGKWKLKSEAPAPASNIMTYEPHGAKGMKITVESVNAKGEQSKWWYTTEFDGKDQPVTGTAPNSMTSVRVIDDRINEIVNKRDGKITQILTNVLSPDKNTLGIIYMRQDEQGKTTSVNFATYERIQ
jgi:hypothetical protein